MMPTAHGYSLGIAYYFVLLVLALTAHGVWTVQTSRAIWLWHQPVTIKLATIIAAVLTPVVGFYAALTIQYFRHEAPARTKPRKWAIIMPNLALCVVLYLTLQQNWRYTEATQSWDNVIRFLLGFFVFYCATHVVFFMAARIFGLAHRGPLATRVHLLSLCWREAQSRQLQTCNRMPSDTLT
jgi:hypothetical protein